MPIRKKGKVLSFLTLQNLFDYFRRKLTKQNKKSRLVSYSASFLLLIIQTLSVFISSYINILRSAILHTETDELFQKHKNDLRRSQDDAFSRTNLRLTLIDSFAACDKNFNSLICPVKSLWVVCSLLLYMGRERNKNLVFN